jgi:ADP-ribose pyrophosphatase YjhB (NUDIX family)
VPVIVAVARVVGRGGFDGEQCVDQSDARLRSTSWHRFKEGAMIMAVGDECFPRPATQLSSRRIDYHDDPQAPKANSLVPSVNVVVVNDAGELLMIRRTDNGNWALPGGAIDLGESVAQAAVRETLEESGIECSVTGIIGIYSDPRHVILYTSNGEVRQEFSIVLTARALSGQPTAGSESSEVRWVPTSQIPRYAMARSMRSRINDYLASGKPPVVS